jgi:alpha-pyrone synthase
MTNVFINQIETSVPDHDVHHKYIDYVSTHLKNDPPRKLFKRMAGRAQIEHRYSSLEPGEQDQFLDERDFYRAGAFPNTQERMKIYQRNVWELARRTCDKLPQQELKKTTHIIVTSCTGFYAPGLDFDVVRHYGLAPSTERTTIGFMGCSAAFNAMKMASHIVRSEPEAQVLMINAELCTLHLQDTENLEELLSFLLFADGCAASLISSKPEGMEISRFRSAILPSSDQQLTWKIGQSGFDMVLSGQVPISVTQYLPDLLPSILGDLPADDVESWAVHPGGRSILDAVQASVGLLPQALDSSRKILREFGNMSSATVMFVLKEIMASHRSPGTGCALALGPGITAESMLFRLA